MRTPFELELRSAAAAARTRLALLVYLGLVLCLACSDAAVSSELTKAHTRLSKPRASQLTQSALARLRSHELELRQSRRAELSRRSETGPDPVSLCAVEKSKTSGAEPGAWASVLRGSSELALLKADLSELGRYRGPAGAVACALSSAGELLVIGEQQSELWSFHSADVTRAPLRLPLSGALTPRALTTQADTAFVADLDAALLFEIDLPRSGPPRVLRAIPTCKQPVELTSVPGRLLVNCSVEHQLLVYELEARGRLGVQRASIRQDGPFWGAQLLQQNAELWIAAGGVEDRPLQRFDGAFGYVDSFLYIYRVDGSRVERVHEINLSDQRVIVPKALLWSRSEGATELWVTGYGSATWLKYSFAELTRAPSLSVFAGVPGVTALRAAGATEIVATSPLLDAWVSLAPSGGLRVQHVRVAGEASPQQTSRKLGEALFFTELMAPGSESVGYKSRFTCETCHFDGGIDGRVHHTGRGDVRVSTRPLFGLLENAPHFSRALDPDLTQVAHNEFRVASLGTSHSPWFALRTRSVPWLAELGEYPSNIDAEALRGALIDFLASFEPAPNPYARGREQFSGLEARGAAVFERRCAVCHAPRVFSDEPSSAIAPQAWEDWIFRKDGALVWARGEYERTEVLPYVHELGTRVPSLRRVHRKFPYFTNGSATSLAQVLASFAWLGERAYHARAPENALRFEPAERAALLAFLRLL